ncbi:heme utilization cystosolic carrier protein HutX [Nitrincola sp. MINF-07-Sa-05]|uniref:heme utilization cystosolic carrier protein HutX n=1 Tax=Nitrincola salilacus TaxID=3400273 RepID=UPI0039186147
MTTLQQQIEMCLQEKPELRPVEVARHLGCSEWEVICSLPDELATCLEGEVAQSLLQRMAGWGPVTTIVEVEGSIFEFKGSLPAGSLAYGYYNLFGQPGQMHGHLKLDAVSHIALISKPLRGKEAYAVSFFSNAGACIFKVYLGRDTQGVILHNQRLEFEKLKEIAYE